MENELTNMSATSIVALFQTTKEQRLSFATQVIESVTEGGTNALNTHLQLKAMEEIIEIIKNDVGYKNTLLQTAEQNGKSFMYQNAKIDIREVGTKYDFSKCGDAIYEMLESESNGLKKKLKERAEFLQKAPIEGTAIVDELSGEVVKVYPPSKSSTTSVVVSLK